MTNKFNGCIMFGVECPNFYQMQSAINNDDLHEWGLETYPHLTFIYGIDNEIEVEKIFNFCKKLPKFDLYTQNINCFQNEEYDVLKYQIDVEQILLDYRRRCLSLFENEQTYPDYNPHCTISYLMPGTAKKYMMQTAPIKLEMKDITYSIDHKSIFKLDL